MFDYWEGYFLLYPLLPLAEYPAVLSLMPLLGKGPLMVLLLGTNAAMTIPFITQHTIIRWGAPLLGILPWVIQGVSAPARKTPPAWLDRIAAIHKKFVSVPTPMHAAEEIQKDVIRILQSYPHVEVVLFPESSLYKLNLDTSRELATYWNHKAIGKPISLLIGAIKWEEAINRNTIYWVYDGTVKESFNKRHAMAVTEAIGWYRIPFLKRLFHENHELVEASTNPRVPFPLLPDVSFIPYICSELFFNDTPDDQYPQAIITELANDYWAKSTYIRHLMFLAARFKAIEWQRPIIYVSYYHNGFLDTEGTITPLHRYG
jgi:apolipoprotein N-acyltransferase